MSRLNATDSFLWQNFLEQQALRDEYHVVVDSGNEGSESDTSNLDDEEGTWCYLPDLLLEKVFSYLSVRDRYYASTVCRHWYDVFYSPSLWRKLVLTPTAFTHQRYTPVKGYWTELSHHKVQMCLKKVGSFLHTVQIEPISEYYNLFEFVRIWNLFMEYHVEHGRGNPMDGLENFYFTFCCENRDQSEVSIYGTGGKLLEELKRLLNNFSNMEELKVNHLLLDLNDAPHVFDPLIYRCGKLITYLEVRNFTKELYPLFVAGMCPNLRTLILSPQQINTDIVRNLGRSRVADFHIVQDHYCEESYFIEHEIWKEVGEKRPDLKVHLSAQGNALLDINWQDGAPVSSITYTTKYSRVHSLAIETITVLYNTSLKVYAHFDLPRYHGSRSFENRCDENLLSLVRTCPKLHTLIVRERISTATLILLAREGRSLKRLYVRRNGLLKRCDWQRTILWDDNFYWTMRRAAHSYEDTFAEVSRCLGFQWQPLSDQEFKRLKPLYCDTNSAQSDFDTS